METALMKALLNAGVGAGIAAMILVGLYRIAHTLGGKLIAAQERQAEAMGSQAQAMQGLTASIQQAVVRDNTEHREMMVLLRFLAQRRQAYEEGSSEHGQC